MTELFVKETNTNYPSINEKEIIVTTESKIILHDNDDDDIPEIINEFEKIKELGDINKNTIFGMYSIYNITTIKRI